MIPHEKREDEHSIIKDPEHSLKEQKILKSEIGVLPMWFGRRLLDDSDLSAFDMALRFKRQFNMYSPFILPDADKVKKANPKIFGEFATDLKHVLDGIAGPLVIFVVSTANCAEYSWLNEFPQKLNEFRKKQNRLDTFVYRVIMGGWFPNLERNLYEGKDNRALPYELKAHELTGVYLYYNTDAPTAGSARLTEFMNRIVGADLPGEYFPNFDNTDVQRIAWHLNRENFNVWSPKEGSIPKYSIGSNSRPIFPF
jgi:hypothetical protein